MMRMSLNAAKAITALDVLVASGFALAGLFHPQAILPAGDAPTPGLRHFRHVCCGADACRSQSSC